MPGKPTTAGPSTRSAETVESDGRLPREKEVHLFYGGLIRIGVDARGHFIGAFCECDMEPDEPLFLPGNDARDVAVAPHDSGLPFGLLHDATGRVIGIHLKKPHRARRF